MSTITTLEPPSSRPSQILMLSAPTLSELETATTNLATYIGQHPELDLADVAYTLQTRNRTLGASTHAGLLRPEGCSAGSRGTESSTCLYGKVCGTHAAHRVVLSWPGITVCRYG